MYTRCRSQLKWACSLWYSERTFAAKQLDSGTEIFTVGYLRLNLRFQSWYSTLLKT